MNTPSWPSRTLLLVPLVTGCGLLDQLRDSFNGMSGRFVVEAVLLGLEEPEDDRVAEALLDTPMGQGGTLTVYLADALSSADLGSAPVSGIPVWFESDAGKDLMLSEEAKGRFTATGEDGLEFVPLDDIRVAATWEEQDRSLRMATPPTADAALPDQHEAGSPLLVDLSEQPYHGVLVLVIDAVTGEVTFDNTPSDIGGFYELAHGDAATLSLTVPGSALPEQSLYAVGVAGMERAADEDLDGVNAKLSTLLAGQFRFTTVCTYDDPALCDANLAELP